MLKEISTKLERVKEVNPLKQGLKPEKICMKD